MIATCNYTKKSKQMKKATIPDAYICPLTKEMMADPLVNRYGVSYERAAIIDHITNQMKPYCPKTKELLSVRDLVPNVKLRMEILNYRQEALGEDTTASNQCNNEDEDSIREVECIRAMTHAFSPPKRPKKGLTFGQGNDMKNMLSRLSPSKIKQPLSCNATR